MLVPRGPIGARGTRLFVLPRRVGVAAGATAA